MSCGEQRPATTTLRSQYSGARGGCQEGSGLSGARARTPVQQHKEGPPRWCPSSPPCWIGRNQYRRRACSTPSSVCLAAAPPQGDLDSPDQETGSAGLAGQQSTCARGYSPLPEAQFRGPTPLPSASEVRRSIRRCRGSRSRTCPPRIPCTLRLPRVGDHTPRRRRFVPAASRDSWP